MIGAASIERPPGSEAAIRVAVVAALSGTTMLFASLASAYFVRRSFADWKVPTEMRWPWALLGLALGISAGLEMSLRVRPERRRAPLAGTALLTASYLAVAIAVIGSLAASPGGLGLPHRAFVVLLLGVHVAHSIFGGVFTAALLRDASGVFSPSQVLLARMVTHFLSGLVLFIVGLLFLVR